ncbi:uncharacterized protein LOC123551090 isoform X2 [Mercenaria mercenaria]|nr:uncharacterized protein LOC123551090 isoform X2 [Mercenaria mercenaria]XP_053380972.1 uncharacterized protein LOC123551090 isoform X2 [Mercenaria mercenaria]XP_053380973.1 uncharacterized protein LOC123551090 isoform X2 [Mercenaria mercenaria]
MESQILAELKSLSDKVTRIQNEISVISKQFSDHILSCPDRHPQSPRSERLTQTELSECDSREDDTAIKYHPLEHLTTGHSDHHENNVQQQPNTQKLHENSAPSSYIRQVDKPSDQEEVARFTHRRSFKENRQECLRKSLQQHIVLLVDSLPYSETDILDRLIETECLTETESSDLRNNGSRKDCVRNLVRIVKGRSYKVLKTFVECVKTLHPEVAASIWQVYEKLVKDKKNYSWRCTFCELKRSVDIKLVADHMWSVGAISDELYDEIVSGNKSLEALWTFLADECNKADTSYRQNALKKLRETLMNKGQYRELVLKLSKVSTLKCTCVTKDVNANSSTQTEGQLTLNIVVTDVDDISTVSPMSTSTSSRSFVDENEVSDDSFPANKHENLFLSPRTAYRDKGLYDSGFGIRKAIPYTANAIAVEFRTSRSNSFGKNTNQRGHLQALTRRRASMFM